MILLVVHIICYIIVTTTFIIDNQKEMEMLKEKITSLTLQVRESEERIIELETMESK